MRVPCLLCLLVLTGPLLAWAEEPQPTAMSTPPSYTIPLRGTTAVLLSPAHVEVVNPERMLVFLPDQAVGAPGGFCDVQAGMAMTVAGADLQGVLVEYHPVPTPPPLVLGHCPYGTLFLLTADQWTLLTPVYGSQEAAAQAQRVRVQRLLLP